jgi:hypothetical protein
MGCPLDNTYWLETVLWEGDKGRKPRKGSEALQKTYTRIYICIYVGIFISAFYGKISIFPVLTWAGE